MNKKITILLCICMLSVMSGAVQAATEPLEELIVMDSQELEAQAIAIDPAIQPNVIYQTHIQNIGTKECVTNGGVSGTMGNSLRLEGIRIFVENYSYDLGVEYQTHIQNIGWEKEAGQGLKTNFQFSGSWGKSYRLEGIKINLTGSDADKFDIIYRTHVQDIGWETKWKKNGEMSGTEGRSLKLEAIVIKIVPKGTEVSAGIPATSERYEKIDNGCSKYPVFNINYVPWKVNFDNSNCQHQWENYNFPYETRIENQLFKYIALHYYRETKKSANLTPLYEADVANGCIYNYVEWQQGHGNTKYPGGITENGVTLYNLTAKRWATLEEIDRFIICGRPAFYYCTKCGQTSLGRLWN